MRMHTRLLLFFTLTILLLAGCTPKGEVVEEVDELGYRTVYTIDPETKLKEGKLEQYDDQGQLTETAYYEDGELEGIRIIFAETGDTAIVENYRDGLFEGTYRTYYEGSKQIKNQGTYHDNRMSGSWYKYHSNGQMAEEVTFADNAENGPFKEWFEDGTLAAEGTYLNGDNEHGLLRVYNEDGSLNRLMDCDKGTCTSVWRDTYDTPPPARE